MHRRRLTNASHPSPRLRLLVARSVTQISHTFLPTNPALAPPTAFIVGAAIPQIQSITGLIAAVAIMQFTYSFPPLLRVGYDVITDAMAADKKFTPGSGASGRIDTWKDRSRWMRVRILLCIQPLDAVLTLLP